MADVGAPSDSRVVDGLVFRKNVVHKLMRTHVSQPRIMMLGSMLEYHRTTGKLSSFDTLLEQVGPATGTVVVFLNAGIDAVVEVMRGHAH